MLLGMVAPTAGHAELFGQRVRAEASGLWRRVGHLVESATAYPELTVRDNLEVARRLQGVTDRAVVGRALERLALGPYADRRAGTLSSGNLQRLALARALLHAPELLVLDEPTNGLDPAGVIEIRELLRALARDRGVTVFLSSHILAEVDRLATRVGILHRGRLLEELDRADLARHRDPRLEVAARRPDVAERALRAAGFRPARRAAPGTGTVWSSRSGSRAPSMRPRRSPACSSRRARGPTRLATTRETLEEHFVRLTTAADAAGAGVAA